MFFHLQNLVIRYENIEALKGISMRLDEGEIVCLIGANGAGKSTTLKAISGLVPLAAGEIWFQEKKIGGLSPQQIVGLGIAHVPEGRQIFPQMRVLENLLMGAYLRRDRGGIREDMESLYSLFPVLKERTRQAAGKLSGGEQQMLAIGRALMARPRLLLLDEPSLGLSPLMVKAIGRTILEINQKQKMNMILVEQNARLAFRISQRGYVMELGRIALEDTSGNLMQNERVKKIYLGEKEKSSPGKKPTQN